MKKILTALFILLSFIIFSQNPGDTIVVQGFNYSQTFSPNGRDTMILFPDGNLTYEKIIMAYNMRCKDGNVSTPGNTNYGCGEWDYSCNTYITDSTRVDSVINYHPSHIISHFSDNLFEYVASPTFNYYQYLQKEVEVNTIITEDEFQLGFGNLSLSHPIKTDEFSGKSFYLLLADEMADAGMAAGDIDGIKLLCQSDAHASFFKVRMNSTVATILDPAVPLTDGFTEVYFADFDFINGENRIQFHTPFNWDGTSNILIEFSFTNEESQDLLLVEGVETGENRGLSTNNGIHIHNDVGYIDLPAAPLASISDAMTVSFWSYGIADFLPAPTSIISGIDDQNQRNLNIHLPWSNSNIYFDCGYDGGSYDRIDKTASTFEYEGQWNHWAFTKNAVTEDMKIYLNGELWHSGTGKTKPISISDLILGNIHNSDRHYFGKIDELRIWKSALEQNTIQEWMYITVTDSHPAYDDLVAYYQFDEGSGDEVYDTSPAGETGIIHDYVIWKQTRGDELHSNYIAVTQRPNIIFLQGEYELTINDEIRTVAVENVANVVEEYEIIPRYGTMLDDSLHILETQYLWEAGYEYIYNPEGLIIDSIAVTPGGSIEMGELTYYRRYPAKFELMSFVTPYGIYLDLGMQGKTWYFDITDYTPILQDLKRLTMERGGERQEDIDIKFLFIVGTPARDVLNIQQLWRPASSGYQNIINDRTFEERSVAMHPDGAFFKIKSVITGHGQEGEFNPRLHKMNVNGGDEEFNYIIWTECSTIPIYPQGGTWLYDRAGWCPGNPSDVYEFDITEYVSPGQSHLIDYTLSNAGGTSNYLVNNQLVTYGPANFELDARIIDIIHSNKQHAAWERFNPACSHPEIIIQNTGSTTISSLDIMYQMEGGSPMNLMWTGELAFMDTTAITLNIDDYSFWNGTDNIFKVEISNPNGEEDENPYNNNFNIEIGQVDVYDVLEWFTIECLTNNQGNHTSYTLTDLAGNILLEMDDLESNTIYSNDITLEPGCYRLRIDDAGDNGLYYWHQSQYGQGHFRLKNNNGVILENFEPEFGRFAEYEFAIVDIVGTPEWSQEATLITTYPNPTSDYVYIDFQRTNSTLVKVEVYNATQARIYDDSFYTEGTTQVINLKNSPPGIYYLHILIKDQRIVKKIIKTL